MKHTRDRCKAGKEIKYDGCQVCDEPCEGFAGGKSKFTVARVKSGVRERCGRYHNRESFTYNLCVS